MSKALLSLADHLESCGGSKDMIEGWTAKSFIVEMAPRLPVLEGSIHTSSTHEERASVRVMVARFLSLDVKERGARSAQARRDPRI